MDELSVAVRPWEPGDDDALLAGFVDAYNRPPWNDAWTLATAAVYLGELRGIPRSTASLDSCYNAATGPASCRTMISEAYAVKEQGDRTAAEKLGIEYVPTAKWFTASGRVMPFAGTTPQRWDGGHITAEYAASSWHRWPRRCSRPRVR
ncbi:hypothetical protein [Microbacterium sp. Leaf288]|uniref:hypothetical protein n=1 Tax=Microbacterium sp. Leaf288 TaxID=1736323 RepID=UPI0012FC27E8|nr:hypothetical protein [Microbacterium sp. Leaf288]